MELGVKVAVKFGKEKLKCSVERGEWDLWVDEFTLDTAVVFGLPQWHSG